MALIMLGGGVTDIRGSIAGTTFARSAAGNYARSRKKPVNPRSPLQNTRRAWLSYLAKYWSEWCTEQERTDWRAYAMGTSWTNKLGQSIEINGLAAFMRLNMLISMYSGTLRHAGPTAMGHGGGVQYTFAAESDTTKIQMNEPTGAFDKGILGHWLLFFQGIPVEPGRIATPKGFKYIGAVYGHGSAPLTYPYEITAAYTMREGQGVTLRAMFQDENYRNSGPHWKRVLAAPSV